MKIVWLGQQEHNMPWLNDLRHELSKTNEVVAYGDGPEFIQEFDAIKIASKEEPSVIMIGSNQYKFKNLDRVNIPKAMKCSDPWANLERHVQFTKENKIDMLLTNFIAGTEQYRSELPKVSIKHLWFAIDPSKFRKMTVPKKYDIAFVGAASSSYYPLRSLIVSELNEIEDLSVFVNAGHSLTFDEYVSKINETKIFAFGNINARIGSSEVIRFAPAKWIEVMACGTLVVADLPNDWLELHLIPDYNFIRIEECNFKSMVKFYLKNNEICEMIAEYGYNTVMKYHTIEVRARELLEDLKEIVR